MCSHELVHAAVLPVHSVVTSCESRKRPRPVFCLRTSTGATASSIDADIAPRLHAAVGHGMPARADRAVLINACPRTALRRAGSAGRGRRLQLDPRHTAVFVANMHAEHAWLAEAHTGWHREGTAAATWPRVRAHRIQVPVSWPGALVSNKLRANHAQVARGESCKGQAPPDKAAAGVHRTLPG